MQTCWTAPGKEERERRRQTDSSEDEDEDEGAGHQARVPGPLGFVHSWDPQEDEDDGLSDAGQSLHRVLHRGPRLLGNVGLHVFVSSDATEGHPEDREGK